MDISSDVKVHTACRVCGSGDLVVYCDLGVQPLANALVVDPTIPEFQAPLAVQHCNVCGLSQLTHTVAPEKLYTGYPFRSGASKGWVEHTQKLAQRIMEMFPDGGWVMDIAANDGTQLSHFPGTWNDPWVRSGMDPSPCAPPDIPMVQHYWSSAHARAIATKGSILPNVIIAQNVLGHVDDVHDFVEGVKIALAPKGVCIIEVPDLWELFKNRAFDTIYHEHLSYWPHGPLARLLADHDLAIGEWESLSIHGGSRRYWVHHAQGHPQTREPATADLILEAGREFTRRMDRDIERALEKLDGMRTGHMMAYGASAKGAVMLNVLKDRGNTVWPEAVIDDTVEKQGKYMPGVHLPIVPPRDLFWTSYLWVLSWNWSDDLQKRAKYLGFQGVWL